MTARAVALLNLYVLYGFGTVFISHQETDFKAGVIDHLSLLRVVGVEHRFTAVYHPQIQGTLERSYPTLKSMMRAQF